jgi:hypothetical protein
MTTEIEALNKLDTETEGEYRMRCYLIKQQFPDLSWKNLARKMNDELGANHGPDAYSKQCKKWLRVEDCSQPQQTTVGEVIDGNDAENHYIYDLNTLLLEIKKEKSKLSDERTQNQAYVRKLSREETLKEMALDVAKQMSRDKQLYIPDNSSKLGGDRSREGILCVSDWHYGIEVDNYFNKYNPVVCAERLCRLRDEVISKGRELRFKKLHVVNLSDLICGRIHMVLRLESRFDVITQVMHVSEIMSEFLSDLSEHFEIEYRDVLDNHSRLEPNKKDSMELESLARLIPWYLEERLKNNKRVKILYNTFADDIISFKIFDYNIVGVHGHKDSPSKVINNMIAATRQRNDLVLTAHLHHFSGDEEQECMRVSNGSLMGVDTHAQDLRLTSTPSQNLIVVCKDNVTEFICKINVS